MNKEKIPEQVLNMKLKEKCSRSKQGPKMAVTCYRKGRLWEETLERLVCYRILWHVDSLLGNNREISKQTSTFPWQKLNYNNEERRFLCGLCRDVTSRTVCGKSQSVKSCW
jgi:hypothetical protein